MKWDPAEFEEWYERLPLGDQKTRVWNSLTADQRKLWNERSSFRQFAKAVPLGIDPRTIKSCVPPEPDILCRVDGELQYFELGEVTDEGLARRRSLAVKRGDAISAGSFLQIEPLCRIYDQKCGKAYTTDSKVVNLVLYYSTDRQVPYTEGLQAEISARKSEIVRKLVKSPFETAWLFDSWSQSIIARVDCK